MRQQVNGINPNIFGQTFFASISRAAKLPARLFLVVGIVLLLWGIKRVYDAHQSNAWLPANGVITVSTMRVDTSTSTGTSSGVGGRQNRTTSTSYTPEVAYDYTLEGVKYSSSEIILGGYVGAGASRARRLLNQYPVGAQVTVYYNPQDPYQSVLERGVHLDTLFLTGFGLGFIAFSMLWRRSVGKFASVFQFGNSSANAGSHVSSVPVSQYTVTARQPRSSTSAQTAGLVGSWKVLNQLPPQSELTELMLKGWGFSDAQSEVYSGLQDPIVNITENTISFVSKGMGALGEQAIPFTITEDRLMLGQLETNILMQKMQRFFPRFFYYHFSGDQLILKSNPIEGYDNQSITYFLSKF